MLVKDKRTSKLPFDLGTVNVFDYDESLATWTLDNEVGDLAAHIGNVSTDASSGNAMWQYFGLTKRGRPLQPGGLEAKVDLLTAELTRLRLVTIREPIEPTLGARLTITTLPGEGKEAEPRYLRPVTFHLPAVPYRLPAARRRGGTA